jgi:hypothetical protein
MTRKTAETSIQPIEGHPVYGFVVYRVVKRYGSAPQMETLGVTFHAREVQPYADAAAQDDPSIKVRYMRLFQTADGALLFREPDTLKVAPALPKWKTRT